jgi:hypothetical protein
MTDKCQTCGKKAHDFVNEEAMECVPPMDVLNFGEHHIDVNYRRELHNEYPMYNSEEVVGSFLGYNPDYPSQQEWLVQQENKTL